MMLMISRLELLEKVQSFKILGAELISHSNFPNSTWVLYQPVVPVNDISPLPYPTGTKSQQSEKKNLVTMGAFQSIFSRLWSKKEVRILILGLV
jgi:hypothetical protein